jgi:hypothetical protein
MTYSTGGLIQATDYNGFVSTTAGANINATWNTTYGQTALSTVSAAATVTATQWATLNSTISSMATHQGTTVTSRTSPVTGNIISVLANVNADITSCYTNRYNAASSGTQFTGWTGTASFTGGIGNTAANTAGTWTATYTDVVTFANATAASKFFGAGGLVKIQFSKTSTGTPGDIEWNSFIANVCGTIYLSSDATSKTINGVTYTGTTKIGGNGTPTTLATGTGFNQLISANTTLYKQFDSGAAYSDNYVLCNATVSGAVVTIYTVWFEGGNQPPGSSTTLTGGTATTGITFGTAPATVVTYIPPEQTNIANVWGSATVASTVANV